MRRRGEPQHGGWVGGGDISSGAECPSGRGQRDTNNLKYGTIQQNGHKMINQSQEQQPLRRAGPGLEKVMRRREPLPKEWGNDNISAGGGVGGRSSGQGQQRNDLLHSFFQQNGRYKTDHRRPRPQQEPLYGLQQAHSSKTWSGSQPPYRRPLSSFDVNQGQCYNEEGMEPKQISNGNGPSFGFNTKLSKFMESPPGTVILEINEDIQAWKAFLDYPGLKHDLLVLAISIIGDKVCKDESPTQQKTNILKACCLADKFIQKLSNLMSDITMGTFPSWARNSNSVDCTPSKLMLNVWNFCNSAFETLPNLAKDLLKSLIVTSVIASTSVAPELTEKFTALKAKLQELNQVKKSAEEITPERRPRKHEEFTEEDHARFDLERPPENIQDIPVIPTIQELRGTYNLFLRPNKPSGAYNDSEHYCDVQFRLFREDFVRPLRNGIKMFLDNKAEYLRKKKMPLGDLRLYCPVSFIKAVKEQDNLVHKLQLSETTYKRIEWASSKRLIFGSLVILTTEDNSFGEDNTHFGIISSRDIGELEKGVVSVVWEGQSPVYGSKQEYLMFESEVYLESRKHTLETLKKLDLEDFPMKKFIVDASSGVEAPKYLRQDHPVDNEEVTEDIFVRLSNGHKFLVPLPLDEDNWPNADDFGLDDNQFEAFRAALTKEFTIIQGPPGTGKTFLGLKITDVLLLNQHLWRGEGEQNVQQPPNPITVVCYTNHALDQFLEGILELKESLGFPVDILRIGGNSKSEKMQEYTLQKVRFQKRGKRPSTYFHLEAAAKEKIRLLEEVRSKRMDMLMGFQNLQGIVNFETVTEWFPELRLECPHVLLENFRTLNRTLFWFGLNPANLIRKDFDEDLWVLKWFKVRKVADLKMRERQQFLNGESPGNELYDTDELMENRILEENQIEADTVGLDSQKKDIKLLAEAYLLSPTSCDREYWQVNEAEVQNQQHRFKDTEKIHSKLFAIENRKKVLLKIFKLYKEKRLILPNVNKLLSKIEAVGAPPPEEISKLPVDYKWALYLAVVERWEEEIMKSVVVVEADLALARKELQDVVEWGDAYVARDCHVVGVTTTGAAKYNNLLQRMRSKIVIVEEAAQVFEAQVVTCITKSCEQLIMIGDHKQLQPNPSVYELAIRYNLNLSLFERMLNNNLHYYPLRVQHRMRPEISDLIRGTIYEELVNHESVSDPELYPDVKGVTKNVFFVTHSELEYCDKDSKSKSNFHEANFIVGLCRYLILQGYRPDLITVLTTYKGQMFLLRGEMRQLPSCEGVRISCVDDYQGEENDIILVSLVRSNEEGNVGFVKIDNRICVTLSRAKQGLFVIGNMDAMISLSETWAQIKAKLESKGLIGQEMELFCDTHQTITKVKSGNDFYELAPDGGCLELCYLTLPCTHICRRVCHAPDREPEDHKCEEMCRRKCENGLHPCKGFCYELPCPPCEEPVERVLHCKWKHKRWMPCHRNLDEEVCCELVRKFLFACGHQKEMKCHEDPSDSQIKCKTIITKPLSVCGHNQSEECWRWNDTQSIVCDFKIQKKFEYCQHTSMIKCCDNDNQVKCEEKCATHLECGHICMKLCHGDEDPYHLMVKCMEPCSRECPSGEHVCPGNHECFRDKACPLCTKIIEPDLPCGHKLRMKCHEFTNKTYKCLQPCDKFSPGPECQQLQHKCSKKCFEECGPCQVKIIKTSRCGYRGHRQLVACSESARKVTCMEPMIPKNVSSCGHHEKYPCKFSKALPEELAKNCSKPCDHAFTEVAGTGCTHKCGGTCGSCLNGRLHMKCQKECGRSLVCGHRCDVKCSQGCPPCKKDCRVKCQHGNVQVKCKLTCGEPCIKCRQQCDWACEHKSCTKRCYEMCDRQPCDEPCPEKVKKCGHPCIGFCGEPCPPLCRICDKETLEDDMDSLAVEAEIENARFVYLEDCLGEQGHTIEVNALEKWLLASNARDDGRIEIGMKCCPLCITPITNCRRFGNIIRESIQDVLAVKMRAMGNMTKSNKLRDEWIGKLNIRDKFSVKLVFPEIYTRLRGFLLQEGPMGVNGVPVAYRPKSIDENSMKSLDFTAKSINKIADEILDLVKKEKFADEQFQQVFNGHNDVFGLMLDRQPLSRQEMLDFNQELDRCDLLKQLMIRRSLRNCNEGFTEAYTLYKKSEQIVTSVLPLTPIMKDIFVRRLKKLDGILRSELRVTEREKQVIVAAVGIGKGHWFKCRNGHPYVIGECGGAMALSICHECKEPIGGSRHRLVRGNQFAPEMDGARAPAYPTL